MRRGRLQRLLRQLVFFAILMGLIAYFAGDAVHGAHGLIAKQRLEAKIAALQQDLSALKARRTRLERDAESLKAKAATEPALLEEEARSVLDLANPADIIIVNDQKTSP